MFWAKTANKNTSEESYAKKVEADQYSTEKVEDAKENADGF